MDITTTPNLKPLRDYDEHDVLNYFAPTGVLLKGTFVTLVNTNSGNTNVIQNTNSPVTPYQTVTTTLSNVPSYAFSSRAQVTHYIKQATYGDPVLGVMLYDHKQYNQFGEDYRFRPIHERHEHQVTIPGEPTPVLTRGAIKTNNINGTPLAGSGAIYSGNQLVPQVYNKSTSIGMFLSSKDADNYALFFVSCI